jgi:hypothetical protein
MMRDPSKQTADTCFNKIYFFLAFLGKAYIVFVLLAAIAIAMFPYKVYSLFRSGMRRKELRPLKHYPLL